MIQSAPTGIFGKLPAHGDFIHRNLSTKFINVWDEWLQAFVACTQERLGDSWLDVYLTSPIWRFSLSVGVIDDNQWAGIILPSVDRVGRYFPFSVISPIPANYSPTEFIAIEKVWFEQIETQALRALDGQIQIDRLVDELNASALPFKNAYMRQPTVPVEAGVVVDMDFEESSPLVTMPHLLDAFVSSRFSSYSIWSTVGSERVEPCTFIAQGLPPASGGAAMLDGLWEHWEWSVPFRIGS